ncbi:MAG: PAS domain S-box protein [Deltaproteobacteria bacterium]|nr:MAG: PAS domain S-box protein [Deltaproteobacteria bacterium]
MDASRTEDFTPLYNSRIINTYVEYLNQYYPGVDTDILLESADMSTSEVEDPGHWFSQYQVDRFHEILVAKTGNKNIAREAGRYTVSAKKIGAPKQYALGLMNLSSVYLMMGTLSSMMTRGATAKVKKLGHNTVEIISTPKPGISEKPYQCENRIGSFESAAKLFTQQYANIDHPECLHKGNTHCRYIVSWERSESLNWKRIRNYFLILSVIGTLILFFVLPFIQWGLFTLSCCISILLLSLFSGHFEKKELKSTLQRQGDAAKDLLEEINIRHNHAVLVQEIGQKTSMILHLNRLISAVVGVIEKRLKFDRGVIMLPKDENFDSFYIGSYGYTNEQIDIMKKAWQKLDHHDVEEFLFLPVKQQKPFLVNEASQTDQNLAEGSPDFIENRQINSLLCVPIVYEKKSLGILMVENIEAKKPLGQSNMSLLLGVASQTANSIINAMSFKKIQESEENYRLLADNITDIIWVLDFHRFQLTFISPSVERILGYSPEEIMDLPLQKLFAPPYFELVTDIITEELAKEESGIADPLRSRTVEVEQYCKDGSTLWLEITASFLRDDKQKPVNIVGVARDISERKFAEKEKKKLEAQLQQAHKLEAVGTLAGGIAHDFNNILSAVIGYTEMSLHQTDKNSVLHSNLREILNAGNRAKDLVKQILAFSRQADQEMKPVYVKLIVKEAIKLIRASLPTTIEIHQNLDSESAVLADPTQIHQVLMNLCTNADHAMRDKGGILTLSLTDVQLDAGFSDPIPGVTPGPYLCLTVSDTGPGMTTEVLDRLFEPFFTTKERDMGTGMGLAVVHGIVTSHGGTVTVESKRGKGSTFKVYLPRIQKEADILPESSETIPTGNDRILFVDDEKALVEMGQQMLGRLGYKVTTRTSSVEALELFRKQPARFDLVITDMTMPNMTGAILAQAMINIRPDIPIILCTGYSPQITEESAMKLGIKQFIMKPMVLKEIAKSVRLVLDEK